MCFKDETFSLKTFREYLSLSIKDDINLLINNIITKENAIYKNNFEPIEQIIKKKILKNGGIITFGYDKNKSIFDLLEEFFLTFDDAKTPIFNKIKELFVPYKEEFINNVIDLEVVKQKGLL